jgi:hypothetical protein
MGGLIQFKDYRFLKFNVLVWEYSGKPDVAFILYNMRRAIGFAQLAVDLNWLSNGLQLLEGRDFYHKT